ncbi:MAG: DNA protecting protein DprA [Candidatus Yonathbacteria bacterium RIFCSPLOWO2_01_FULL_43_27]|uniref:DNA protecting protein DprA n=2 Tax=Parcubacteria group TaxID=1794811 RepID=A0A1G2SE80_9BACT|nr:MAG: protecting protein DprA protein [Candidatus Azambacteria bacterium GW2011_GWA1_44_9]OHA78882.1 MAG: DNA protecting protein DprA [Candidatus Yonathbacteria bacterium RIFCSPHIGHO2_01_FULL_44_19]OHA82959.1 MAG: DNA protecting protein DprA [Candidatus Yonathbacteria bacterium RIFCSPLOWO2_01_FULL_43_27]
MSFARNKETRKLSADEFPSSLLEIPCPPSELYLRGTLPDPAQFYYLAVVGSRKYTSYGREVAERIIEGLAGYPICIVSGLALGIDGIAHQTALATGLPTVAIPGSGLSNSVLYPRTNLGLAHEILENGGALLSEYPDDLHAAPWTFPQRNRIMAGISAGTLVIEAEEKSGTLITARLALDYNRNVFAVPGSIFSAPSKGTNKLIKQGATPITSAVELLEELGLVAPVTFTTEQKQLDLELFSPDEQVILLLLNEPRAREDIMALSTLPPARTLSTLTILEIKNIIEERMGKIEKRS